MKEICNLPTNGNTLFLRNIETTLIFGGIISPSELTEFRKTIAPSILNLLEKYKFFCEDESHSGLKNQYIGNTIQMRKHFESYL